MHAASTSFVAQAIERHDRQHGGPFRTVLDIGGRDVNGSHRSLFGQHRYASLDIVEGPSVDIVADAFNYEPILKLDCVLCTNVLEHIENWRGIIAHAFDMLLPGGWFIVTTPADPFPPHSQIDGGPLRPDEHYANISGWELVSTMHESGFEIETIVAVAPDSMAVGVKP